MPDWFRDDCYHHIGEDWEDWSGWRSITESESDDSQNKADRKRNTSHSIMGHNKDNQQLFLLRKNKDSEIEPSYHTYTQPLTISIH